ncbi:relaxase/mobilization nuclease domain-containing protein [Mycobacteroides salmoniphilum]|uniref:relaxase/mobilization nuclease domain-containing protein n=1 Tax=Mycobacteroides salmoniphilum TaxID=404941 RepID=UPI000BFF635B|nr:hypothetical protein [Mycobacteroides salmoniphilum]
MIAKITHGRSASQALAYDHGPGRADEHVNPHRVAGNIAGREWRVRAHTMQRFVSAHQNTKQENATARGKDGQGRGRPERGVYRIALANPNTDRVLSDREWRQIADTFTAKLGADKGPWEATRHDAHHIHLTISKYGYDGSRMSESHDYRRVASICRELEAEHGLTNAAQRSGRGSGRVRADKEHAARTQAAGRGEPPKDRDWLRETVGQIIKDGGGIDELRAAGVEVKLNQASTGRVSGISYARISESRTRGEQERQGDHGVQRDGGEQIWFKGSQLGKAYSWNQVREHLDQQPAPQQANQLAPPQQQPDNGRQDRAGHENEGTESGPGTGQTDHLSATDTGRDGRGGRDQAGGRDDGPGAGADSGSGGDGGGAGQQIRDPGGPWMPPGEIGQPPMTRRAAALEQARQRQAERIRRREQSRDDHGRDR